MLFGNKDRENWTHFWTFIKKTHPIVDQSNKTIIIDQDKGSLAAIKDIVPSAGRFYCSVHHQQNLVKKMRWQKGSQSAHSKLAVQSTQRLQVCHLTYMHPTDCHYLFNVANKMQFPAARCAQGNLICMYGKSTSSGVESMTRANDDILQRMAVDILNAALILLNRITAIGPYFNLILF